MGANDRENDRKQNKRDKAKAARSRRAAAAGEASFDAIDWIPVVALVEALVYEQGALRIGLTRDGGAFALGVYLGDDYATEYIKPAEDFETAMDEIAAAWLPDEGQMYHQRKAMRRKSAQ